MESPVAAPGSRPGRSARDGVAIGLTVAFLACQAWLVVLPALGTPEGRVFQGFPFIPTDHLQYAMVTQQARAGGGLFYRNLFTTQPQDGRFLMAGLTATGWIERWTALPDPVALHGLRLAALALVCALAWGLCRRMFRTLWDARIAYTFLLFAGGLDWLYPRLASLWTSGASSATGWGENPWNYSFFWGACIPTWVLPLIPILLLVRRAVARTAPPGSPDPPPVPTSAGRAAPGIDLPLLGGALFAVTWSVHPYSAILLGPLVATLLVLRVTTIDGTGARLRTLARDAVLAAPGFLLVAAYLAWASGDPVFRSTNLQAGRWMAHTPLTLFPIVYGPQLGLLAFGMGRDRPGERGFGVILAWAAVALVLSQNPFVAGTKFQFLLTVPLLLLEARGLVFLRRRLLQWRSHGLNPPIPSTAPERRRHPIPWAILLALLLSANSLQGLFLDTRSPSTREVVEVAPEELEALGVLRDLPPGGVLCDARTGLRVPSETLKPVFVGHWFLSTRYPEKEALVRWFFGGTATPEQRQGFLRSAGIRFVLHGPRENASGPVPEVPGLRKVWERGEWSIEEWTGP